MSNLIKGAIYVRLQPIAGLKADKYASKDEIIKIEANAQASLLFKIEHWLNSEVSTQAFEKFGAGVRLHLPE